MRITGIVEDAERPRPIGRAGRSLQDTRQTMPWSPAQQDRRPETSLMGASTTFMPWLINYEPAMEFGERIECLSLRGGSIGRVRIATDVAAWARGSVGAHSTPGRLYANFVIAGEVEIRQGSHVSVAKAGDVILYDRPLPVTFRKRHKPYYEDVSFAISKYQFMATEELEKLIGNVTVLRRDNLLPPLSSSLAFLADNMSSLSRTDLAALFNACVSLLPVALAQSHRSKGEETDTTRASHFLSALLDFVNRDISNADLSPQAAALNLDISVRYVHKLFAARRTTFGSYVMSKRLELVRKEMTSPSALNHRISAIAYRCGFNDLSTFNRSFKRRYGVTPRKFRSDASRPSSP